MDEIDQLLGALPISQQQRDRLRDAVLSYGADRYCEGYADGRSDGYGEGYDNGLSAGMGD